MPSEKSAGAVIFRKEGNKIYYLLLRYPRGARKPKPYWDFPKGHIEKGEKELDTVKREVGEETGLEDIEFVENFKEQIKYFFVWERKNILKFVTFYLAEAKEKDVKISSEHIGFVWLPYDKAVKKLTFKMPKELSEKPKTLFQQKIYKVVKMIPTGQVFSYKKVARLIGHPKAWRAVGNALNKNTDAEIPCHRVVRSDGLLGGYNQGGDKKAFLLRREGVKIN